MSRILQLHYHVRHSKFVLIEEGQEWRQEFNSLGEAMVCVSRLMSGSIPLIQLEEDGSIVTETLIEVAPPRSPEEK